MKVISGAQTGVDQAALRAARGAGLKTGGVAPRGYRTDEGPRPDLGRLYGVEEHASPDYSSRTYSNVKLSDATLTLGTTGSPGWRLTTRYAAALLKPTIHVARFEPGSTVEVSADAAAARILTWLFEVKPSVLNVAGNRERMCPGIGAWAEATLIEAFWRFK